MGWISVKDKLPEDNNVNVLVIGSEYISIVMGSYIHYCIKNKGTTSIVYTHWMPLPAPPNSEKEQDETYEAWEQLYQIADGCIDRELGVINGLDFIKEGKQLFDLKLKNSAD